MRHTISCGRPVLAVLVGLMAVSALGMPPRPGVKMSQAQLDEQARLGVNVVTRPVRNAGLSGLRNTPGDVTPLVTGTKKFVVAAIQFPDYSNTYTTASFDSMLFGTWFSGSAKSYYQQVSYGEFNLTGSISGWYTSSQNRSYYGNGQGSVRAAMLVKEAAIAADASVNYADFDNDGDGYVDVFTCLHAGYGAEESGSGSDIWSHAWSFTDAGIGAYTTNDPWPGHSGQYITVDDYTVDPERSSYTNRGTMACIGVFCHEWGHALGLPDLYDTDGGGEGLGGWSLMASGSWGGDNNSPYHPAHLDAWSKMQLGWWNPRAVRMPASYSIPQVETNSNGYWLMGRNRTFKEYLLVENRRKVGFDTTLLNNGLLIYHVDESVIARRLSNNQVNAGGAGWRYGVALEQADGADHLYNGNNRGDANDPWPGGLGRTVFDSATTPDTRTNYPTSSPQYTGSYARNILASAPTASCSLSSGFTGQFTGGPDAGNYRWIDSDTADGPAYGWNDISTGGTLLGYGDEARWSVTLPFNFSLYGTSYSTIWVSTNGWLSFGSDPGTNDSINRVIPNAAAPNAAAFVYWENLDVVASDSGGIYYRNFGTSPNCSTVVMWKNARRKGLNGGSLKPINPVSFQVVLYEQNNRVVMRYRDCAVGDTLFSWGRGASVGVENSAGAVGLQYLYNGSPTGNLLANERAIEFRHVVTASSDVGVSRIVVPTGAVDSGVVVTPACSVYNYGTTTETYAVRMKVGSSYNQTMTVTNHAPGTRVLVSFPNWTALPRGTWAVTCSTELTGDDVPGNDRQSGSVSVNVRDAQAVSIIAPTGTIDSGSVVTPQATVKNNGTAAATFDVRMTIGAGYTNTQTVTALSAGATQTVTFTNWTPTQRGGPFAVRCTTMLASDMVGANNLVTGTVTVNVRDAQALAILAPVGAVDSGAVIVPQATVRNNGGGAATFDVRMAVGTGYTNQQTVTNLASGATQTVTFADWIPDQRGGPFAVRCTTMLTGDMVPVNNLVTGNVTVNVRDAQAVAIIAPTGTVDSGSVTAPQATVKNNGTAAATFDVRMTIGAGYTNQQTVTGLAAGATQTVTFADWTAVQRGGPFAVRCSTMLTGDLVTANDVATAQVTVNVRDVQTLAVLAPTGAVDSGSVTAPQAMVQNNGTTPATFDVRMTIATGYTNQQTVTGLAAGATQTVTFVDWTAVQRGGPFAVRCSTLFAGDMVGGNNLAAGEVLVNVRDVAATRIGAPVGQLAEGTVITPACTLRNFGNATETYAVRFRIGSGYDQTQTATNHLPGTAVYMTFPTWTARLSGAYAVSCSTGLAADLMPDNDVARATATVGSPGWAERSIMPAGQSGKAVRDGGWLAFNPGDGQVYAAKGNKQSDFFAYDPAADSWHVKAAYPGGLSGKTPYKGATACTDGAGTIFATKGNNTLEFFRYGTAGNTWAQLADVPAGIHKVKGGADLAYVPGADTDYVYLLKGYKNEFYRYSVASGRWQTMPSAPTSAGIKYDRGSFLVYDGAGTLYAHQSKYNKLYAFDVVAKAWRASPVLEGMPLNSGITGRRNKKSKDGGCGVWSDGSIYALKGGNTQEFYRYLPVPDSWRELDTMPSWGRTQRKRKVRAGADITSIGEGLLLALKGNKTLEVWRYLDGGAVMAGRPDRDGVTVSGGLTIDDCRLSIAPNPLVGGHVTVCWSLRNDMEVTQMRLVVYDAAGRAVVAVNPFPRTAGSASLDLGGLSGGVYLVRLDAGATVLTSKLIIAR